MSTPAFANALAITCHVHHARPGEFCWTDVGGICSARITAAARGYSFVPGPPESTTLRGPKLSRDALEMRVAAAESRWKREAQVRSVVARRARR